MSESVTPEGLPSVRVVLPAPPLRLFPGAAADVRIQAYTVSDMLDVLNQRWPGMRDRLADTSPAVRRHINIFVDGQRAQLQTPLVDGADVYVLTAMSGG
ncbi:MAG: MoaD/ThiS family protein [Pseudomonadota bacterium]